MYLFRMEGEGGRERSTACVKSLAAFFSLWTVESHRSSNVSDLIWEWMVVGLAHNPVEEKSVIQKKINHSLSTCLLDVMICTIPLKFFLFP